ncbi:hypothetical protein D3C81_2226110 [compost metagenome]
MVGKQNDQRVIEYSILFQPFQKARNLPIDYCQCFQMLTQEGVIPLYADLCMPGLEGKMSRLEVHRQEQGLTGS